MTLPTFNVPPIGPVQGKHWGRTQLVFAQNAVEAHSLCIREGGFSSKHRHVAKWNRFLVLSGTLQIHVYHDDDADADVTVLTSGQITDIPPSCYHRFCAVTDVKCIEMYWVSLEAGDIERADVGGGAGDKLVEPAGKSLKSLQ